MQRKRRTETQVATFRVTYPWGSTYIDRLRPALRRLGFRTMSDPFVEGLDCGGFFVSADSKGLLNARILIRDYDKALDNDEIEGGDDREWEKVMRAIERVGAFEHVQDWKHFDADSAQLSLRHLGVRLSVENRPPDREGYAVFKCTLCTIAPPRVRRASRSPQPKQQSR